MNAAILPFRDPDARLPLAARLAARRAYREGCRALATRAVGQAFTESGRLPGTAGLGVDDALPLFVAAMRRELRHSGLF